MVPPKAKYKWQWRCTRHGAVCNTRAGAYAHESMSAGKCNIRKEQVRSR